MPSILYVITKSELAGAQRVVLAQAQAMVRAGWEVHLACGDGGELVAAARSSAITVHDAPLDNPIRPWRDFRALITLTRLMRSGRFDVVHANSTKAGILGVIAGRLSNTRVVVFTAHGFRSLFRPLGTLSRWFWLGAEAAYCSLCDRVIAVCETDYRAAVRAGVIDPARAVVIHNGVDLARLSGLPDRANAQRALGIVSEGPVVGVVARLAVPKGLFHWLQAARVVAHRRPDVQFVIVGDGPQRAALVKSAQDLGLADKVLFAGWRDGVASMAAFDVFLLSSEYEGHCVALLEALGIGIPTVATDAGGNPEIVVDGKTGLLVPPGQPQEMAKAILRLLDQPRLAAALAEAGRAHVRSRFGQDPMVEQTQQLYQQLLQEVDERRASWLGTRVYDGVKRLSDIVVSAAGLIVSIPVWAVVGPAILLDDGLPILYRQARVGRGGNVFHVMKFRSTIKDAEKHGGAKLAVENDPRVTRVGRILRKTALDEVPQLTNIFKGDMSWVGPRPERPEFVRRFQKQIPGYGRRHRVRPGLTGVAQVYGRNYTEASEKIWYDLYYIRHRSLLLDLRLFIRSWLITFKGRWDSGAKKQ